MTATELKAIDKVVEMYLEDELQHYQEHTGEEILDNLDNSTDVDFWLDTIRRTGDPDHIFYSLLILQKLLLK